MQNQNQSIIYKLLLATLLTLLIAVEIHQLIAIRKLQDQEIINNEQLSEITKEIENEKTSLVGLQTDTLISLMGKPSRVTHSKLSDLLKSSHELEYFWRAQLLAYKYNLSVRADIPVIEWTYEPPEGYGGKNQLICIDKKNEYGFV
jgi:hypothetical protein